MSDGGSEPSFLKGPGQRESMCQGAKERDEERKRRWGCCFLSQQCLKADMALFSTHRWRGVRQSKRRRRRGGEGVEDGGGKRQESGREKREGVSLSEGIPLHTSHGNKDE